MVFPLRVVKCREPDHSLDGNCHNTVQSQFASRVQKSTRKYGASRLDYSRRKLP